MESKGGYVPALHPEFDGPAPAMYLFHLFWEVSEGRSAGGFGASTLTHADILAWCQLTGQRLTTLELEAIRAIDRIYVKESNGSDNG